MHVFSVANEISPQGIMHHASHPHPPSRTQPQTRLAPPATPSPPPHAQTRIFPRLMRTTNAAHAHTNAHTRGAPISDLGKPLHARRPGQSAPRAQVTVRDGVRPRLDATRTDGHVDSDVVDAEARECEVAGGGGASGLREGAYVMASYDACSDRHTKAHSESTSSRRKRAESVGMVLVHTPQRGGAGRSVHTEQRGQERMYMAGAYA